jgi:hypothetical protein
MRHGRCRRGAPRSGRARSKNIANFDNTFEIAFDLQQLDSPTRARTWDLRIFSLLLATPKPISPATRQAWFPLGTPVCESAAIASGRLYPAPVERVHNDGHNLYGIGGRLDLAKALSPSLAPVGRALFPGGLLVQVIGDAT